MAEIEITASDGAGFAAYMASPETGKGPGILLIQEIFGVNANMRQIADGFAAAGYVVLCPDLFWRQGPGVQLTGNTQEEFQRAFGLLEGFDMEKGIDDLKSTLTALRDLDACTGKAGSVGYCLGGRLAYLMATRSDADCNVSYYGVGIEGLLDEMKNISRPLLMHVAEEDQFVPKDAQKSILEAASANALITTHTYPGADHAFAREGGDHYEPDSAKLADGRTAAFFKTHLA